MKIDFKILAVFILILSCQDTKNEKNSLSSKAENEETSQKIDKDASKVSQDKPILNKAQFEEFFPKEIGEYKLINVSVLKSSALASASYIKGNDYSTSLTYSLQDGSRKGSAELKNFELSYKLKDQGPEGTEYIYTEREGYKTIAFSQPKINRSDVRFIYNNRFRITMEGNGSADLLWSYIDFDNLKKLD